MTDTRGELGCESASNRNPARFQSICLIRYFESALGGVPIAFVGTGAGMG
jgi:hypothetical protein